MFGKSGINRIYPNHLKHKLRTWKLRLYKGSVLKYYLNVSSQDIFKFSVFAGPEFIWIVGSSLIIKAHRHVKQRPMGDDLALFYRYGKKVIWVGNSGLHFDCVINLCQALRNYYVISMGLNVPNYLLVHAGGNDIGRVPTQWLRRYICSVLNYLINFFPGTSIVWSCILPRLKWRYSDDTAAMERSRTRINRAVIQFVVSHGGYAIKHPDFQDKHPALFSDDCHLSFIGNDIFLNTFQGAFETFINHPEIKIYPVE